MVDNPRTTHITAPGSDIKSIRIQDDQTSSGFALVVLKPPNHQQVSIGELLNGMNNSIKRRAGIKGVIQIAVAVDLRNSIPGRSTDSGKITHDDH